ncbi:hypothetical protein DICVIV_06410 [Dictyocaulus viviparus]|uniref:Uncharacterized protein n=1 Tax=Dictyocaulus viviparus TaxID=29172 RepID=A0A0D8XSA2_DICVI|nr:hypothetical protein DICVIV_06410 [Dictyocaulus viviparus]
MPRKENVGMIMKISIVIKMEAKLFDPYTYLDKVSPTPQKSFLTTNYNARVNSKIWRRRSRKTIMKNELSGLPAVQLMSRETQPLTARAHRSSFAMPASHILR